MFCRNEALAGPSSHPSVLQLRQSCVHERLARKQKSIDLQANFLHAKGLSEPLILQEDKDTSAGNPDDNKDTSDFIKSKRHQLEKDVFGLQDKLQEEVDLHCALENAFMQEAGAPTGVSNIPAHAKKLISEVAMLELAISSLEDHITLLNFQLDFEKRQRLVAESTLVNHPCDDQEAQRKDPHYCQSFPIQEPSLASSNVLPSIMSPRLFGVSSPCKNTYTEHYTGNLTSQVKECPLKDFFSATATCPWPEKLVHNAQAEQWQQTGFFSPKKLKPLRSPLFQETSNRLRKPLEVKHSWNNPNKLSEEMVKCMINIYMRLSNVDGAPSCKSNASPTSPYGISSISSFSESSSTARSPPIDLGNKELGSNKCFDPYKLPDKIFWSDIGAYASSVDVTKMSVGKEQLEYAAETLQMFRSLVEQLSRVNPGIMKHNEKLAFWINIYNALMMHAYLAYGVPKNDFKFFSLMQKAAYTVGCHSFNAVVIEHLLLKAKAQWYRPQIALLLEHQKLKLREEVRMFAIDCIEPLVAFSLSFGARSSPAVQVYTAQNVHNELQSAMQDYTRAAVGVSTKGKLLVPKLLYDFGVDIVEETCILDWICNFLPLHQSNLIQSHTNLMSKHMSVIPFDFHFRYLFLLKTHRTETV